MGSDPKAVDVELVVVPADFPIPVDGIIGKDFIKFYKCTLDYFTNTFTIRADNLIITLPIKDDSCYSTYHKIPARCEVIRYFSLKTSKTEDQLVLNEEIFPGVFVATSIINPKSCFLRILNTNSRAVEIKKKLHIKLNNLSDFHILSLSNDTDIRRDAKLEEALSNNIPRYAPQSLLALCQKFSDIFFVPGDKHTVNNFYTQHLEVTDNNPVYIKNYRNPHSLKEETARQIKEMLQNKIIEPRFFLLSYNYRTEENN